jgi:hypothetical protein
VTSNVHSWRKASVCTQLAHFPRLSANVSAILRLGRGPNSQVEMVAVVALQTWRYAEQLLLMQQALEEQLRLMHRALNGQAVAVRGPCKRR